MTLRIPVNCTCAARPTPPPAADILPDPVHSTHCLITAANTPHAMVNEAGEVFYPVSPEDALLFHIDHGAEFLHTDFRWSEEDSLAPTTGAPVEYNLPEGCRCHIREDIDWGEVLALPRDGSGCPVHTPLTIESRYGLVDTTPVKPCTPPYCGDC